jgi:hypothetical protein
MKKSMLSLQVTFLVVLGTIAVMVIVLMITKWSSNINRGVEDLTNDDKEAKEDLIELDISMYSCDRQLKEMTKNVQLCMDKGKVGKLPSSGSCYLLHIGQCNFGASTILQGLSSLQISANDVIIDYTPGDSKVFISWDYTDHKVEIS